MGEEDKMKKKNMMSRLREDIPTANRSDHKTKLNKGRKKANKIKEKKSKGLETRELIRNQLDSMSNEMHDEYIKEIEANISNWIIGQSDLEFDNRQRVNDAAGMLHGELAFYDKLTRNQPNFQNLKVNPIRKRVERVYSQATNRNVMGSINIL